MKNEKLQPLAVVTQQGRVNVRFKWRGDTIHFAYCLAGKVFRGTTKTSQIREAREIARSKVLAHVEGEAGAAGDVMLHTAVDQYIQTRWPAKTGRTYTTAAQVLKQFKAGTPDQDLARLGFRGCVALCQAYADALVARYSTTTVHNHQRVVHRFFASLRKRTFQTWEANPASKEKLELPAAQQGETIPLTEAEVAALLRCTKGTQVYPMVLLCAGAGLRPVAAINRVERRHLELTGQQPKVWTHEKNVRAAVRLDPWTAAELRTWLSENPGQPNDPLWPKVESMAYREIRRLRAQAGLPERVNLEALRKYHVTMCYAVAGMLPQQEAKRNRHSVAIAEREYLDWAALDDTTGIRKMGNHLKKLSAKLAQNLAQKPRRRRVKTA